MQCLNTEKKMKGELAGIYRSSRKPLPSFLAVWVLKFCSLNVRGCLVIKNASLKMTVFWPELVLRVLSKTWLKKNWPTHLAWVCFLIIYLQHLMCSCVYSQFGNMSGINCFYGKWSVWLWKSFILVYELDVISCHLHRYTLISFPIEIESLLCVTNGFVDTSICLVLFNIC